MRELASRLADELETGWSALARPSQLPPPGDWSVWLILAGRGFGGVLFFSFAPKAIHGFISGVTPRLVTTRHPAPFGAEQPCRLADVDHGELALAFALQERARIEMWRNKAEAMRVGSRNEPQSGHVERAIDQSHFGRVG
jgi:hypothetical protein